MAYIRVDYKRLEHTADTIDVYITRHNNNMKKIDGEIIGLSSSWQGEDYSIIKAKWDEMNTSDSTSKKMLKALENYSQFLRNASKLYENAQNRALNRADSLPRW